MTILLSKLLGVGRCTGLYTLISLKVCVGLLEHLLVAGLHIFEGFETSEVFEGCIDWTLRFTQLPNLFGYLLIRESHLTCCADIL